MNSDLNSYYSFLDRSPIYFMDEEAACGELHPLPVDANSQNEGGIEIHHFSPARDTIDLTVQVVAQQILQESKETSLALSLESHSASQQKTKKIHYWTKEEDQVIINEILAAEKEARSPDLQAMSQTLNRSSKRVNSHLRNVVFKRRLDEARVGQMQHEMQPPSAPSSDFSAGAVSMQPGENAFFMPLTQLPACGSQMQRDISSVREGAIPNSMMIATPPSDPLPDQPLAPFKKQRQGLPDHPPYLESVKEVVENPLTEKNKGDDPIDDEEKITDNINQQVLRQLGDSQEWRAKECSSLNGEERSSPIFFIQTFGGDQSFTAETCLPETRSANPPQPLEQRTKANTAINRAVWLKEYEEILKRVLSDNPKGSTRQQQKGYWINIAYKVNQYIFEQFGYSPYFTPKQCNDKCYHLFKRSLSGSNAITSDLKSTYRKFLKEIQVDNPFTKGKEH